MRENNVLADKTINFSIRIVKCYNYLMKEKNEFIMSKQMMRSGTSIGANVHEGIFAQSRLDFISKLNIALKEASETSYWLVLLHKTDYLEEPLYKSLKGDVDEIVRIIISSIKTSRNNESNEQ
jgi:four helix bundle protein